MTAKKRKRPRHEHRMISSYTKKGPGRMHRHGRGDHRPWKVTEVKEERKHLYQNSHIRKMQRGTDA